MNNILVVGGGTAGLVSALILKRRFGDKDVTVVKSDKIGIIGVGEGSTEHWKNLMDYVQIDVKELIKETDATLKLGVMFEDWTEKPYFHNVTPLLNDNRFGQYLAAFGSFINNDIDQLDGSGTLHKNNEVFFEDLNKGITTNQFHFNTFKLNEFLLKKCNERNINIVEDEITDVIVNDEKIEKLIGTKNEYNADFYIDSTGFKRLLISKLGAKWNNYNEYLKLNHAIAFQTEDTDNYNNYTLSKAMKYGWMWRIPVYGRWGNGYVFDDTLITTEQAKKEVEEVLGKEITVARDIKFEAGSLDKPWIGNCVAVGLCANFIEPLEATSIGTSINQMFMLMHLITNYKQTDIDSYNEKMELLMNNIRDFVFVHYMVDRKDTEFWKKVSKIEPPETLKQNLKKWKHRLPIKDDFQGTEYHLFFEQNWASVLWGLGLFNKDEIKKEYNSYPTEFKNFVENNIEQWKKSCDEPKISHKEFLSIVREV